MVTFFILINVKRNCISQVAERLLDEKEISEVYSVTGQYDLVAIARTRDNEELADLVTNRLAAIEDIEKTDTMLSFKVYSRHDLESMFSF